MSGGEPQGTDACGRDAWSVAGPDGTGGGSGAEMGAPSSAAAGVAGDGGRGPAARPGGDGQPPAAAAARRLIEHLRSGVPLPPNEPPLTAGRARLLARAGDLLDTVAAKGSRALALQANYGDGKTHALRTIWHLAAERNFVVSNVVLTRDTPLDRMDRVYPKLIADTYLPGAAQPGIERLVQGLSPGSAVALRVLRFAEDNLHPKLHAVLRNLIDGGSTEAVEPLLRDLAQLDMGLAEVKRIHRGNFGGTLKLERFSPQRDVRDYFRLVDFLVSTAGYTGWVVLFDEAELIGRLGRGGRARSYANIGRLATEGMGCAHLAAVFAVASNFYDTVLARRHDATASAAWLETRDPEGAEFCRLGIAALQEAMLLEPLTSGNWLQMMQALLDAHETAYHWSSGLTAPAFWQEVQKLSPETDTKLRTRLRVAIQWLDLLMQHGHAPQVRLHSGAYEVPLQETWADEAAAAQQQ